MNSQNLTTSFKFLVPTILFLAGLTECFSQADSLIVMENELVNTAWINSTENDKLSYEIQIAEEERMIHKRFWWTEGLTVQFNYNEAHARKDNDLFVQGLVFPRFNLGASFNIGNLINYKREQSIKRLSVKVVESEFEQERTKLKSQVRECYQNYLYADELLGLRIQAEVDANENYTLASTLFNAGEMGLDEFKKVAAEYYTAKEATLDARLKKEVSKIRLEGLTGESLDN